jgi:hypothetical protein
VALAYTAVVAGSLACLYFLVRACIGRGLALAAFSCLVALAFASGTRGPATTYVFDGTLQPSAVSSAWFFAAAWCFAERRFLGTGLFLALSGLFHVNLLVLLGPAFALAHLLLGTRGLFGRLARQLLPAGLVLIGFLPMLAAAATTAPDAALARHIWHDVRFPHHFQIRDHLAELGPLVAWQLIGAGAALPMRRTPAGPALTGCIALIGGLVAVQWLGVAAALLDQRAAAVLSWRVAPHAELLLQAISCVAVVMLLARPERVALYNRWAVASIVAGLTVGFASYLSRRHAAMLELLALLVVCSVAAVFAYFRPVSRVASGLARIHARAPWLLTAGGLAVAFGFGVGPVLRLELHSTLLTDDRKDELALYAWMRARTAKDALFLTPPDIAFVRLIGERAIVVDWKSPPGLPAEVVVWFHRLEDVTGRPGLAGPEDLAGYAELDRARLDALRARYRFDFAVVRRASATRLPGYERAFENPEFVVLRTPGA